MKYTHIIWDFNGTLLNDVDISFEAANQILLKHNLPLLKDIENYKNAFGFPIIEYYKRIGFDFQKVSYDIVAHEWVENYKALECKSYIFEEAFPVLEWVKQHNLKQLILSATEYTMLKRQLSELNIVDYFHDYMGSESIYGYGKEKIAQMWIDTHKDAKVLFIGDTEHDAQIAQILNADCILLSVGHRPYSELIKQKSLFVTDNHKEILTYLKNQL